MSRLEFYKEEYDIVLYEIIDITNRTKNCSKLDVSNYRFWNDFKHSTHWRDWMKEDDSVCYENFLGSKLYNLKNRINRENMKK